MSFHDWVHFELGIEKRYANDPDDSGGETWYGFTKAFLKLIDEPAPKTIDAAINLYQDYIWDEHGLDKMDWLVAWCYGDALVHHNPRSAAKCLQAGLGVKQDGFVGPLTREAARSGMVRRINFWERYYIRRTKLIHAIAKSRNKDMKFIVGWQNRITKLTAAAYRADR